MGSLNFTMLDFSEKEVTYAGKSYPTGTIAAEALNINGERLAVLEPYSTAVTNYQKVMSRNRFTEPLLLSAKNAVYHSLLVLSELTPFAYLKDMPIKKILDFEFTMQNAAQANAIPKDADILPDLEEKYGKVIEMLKLTELFSTFYNSLANMQRLLVPFIERLSEEGFARTKDGYAEAFGVSFPEDVKLDHENCSWLSLANTTVQYVAVCPEGSDVPRIVTRMHFASLAGLIRADFFEGLRVGNAPRKCEVCGRWFLTTNARPTRYCSGICPGDEKGRSCRAIGNQRGVEARELAENNPVKIACGHCIDAIKKRVSRGTLESRTAERMKRIVRNMRDKAIADPVYAQGDYKKDLDVDALLARVQSMK